MKHCSRFALPLLFGTCTFVAWGQSTATLSGTLTDPSGAVVPHAHVVVHSLATGADRDIDTDADGLYVVPSLQPGDYSVKATADGFSAYTVQKVTLDVDQKVTVDMHLALSSSGETVQVESTGTQIESTTMTVGQVIDRTTVQEIPLNGRHFLDLTVLTPGGVVAPTSGFLTGASRGLGANSFITAGNREDSVNFQINGVNLNDILQGQITFQPSINTTSEFKINNSTFSAEYGRSSGSIVNVSTRSGTNQFHGEAFDFFRNEALDARNYFNRSSVAGTAGDKAPLKRNNFGAAVGGPIWKGHTFFFASYEGLRQHQGILQNSEVLSAAQRAAVVAAGMPAANAMLAVIPVANDSTGTHYVAFTPGPVNIDQFTGDVLHQINANDQLHGFYAFQRDVRTEPALQGDTIPGFGDHRNARRQVLTINETHIFNANLVNEARLGFNRIGIVFTPNTLPDPLSYGIVDTPTNPGNIGLPQTTLSDLGLTFGGPTGFPQGRYDTLGVFANTTTYLKGKHSVKFGGEFRRYLSANFAGDTGALTYASTANNFTLDNATGFSIQPTTVSSRIYGNAAGLFVQDNFKLTPQLTLEYGLRFEWNGTPTEGENRFVIFNPATVSLIQTGTNGVGSVYKQNYNYEPRLGFAYDVFGTGKTVVRGGYGYMADQPAANAVSGLSTNPPFSTKVSFTGSTATPDIPLNDLWNSAKSAGISISNINPNFKNAYTQTYNLNVQQALPGGMVASVGYYGSVGRHLRIVTNQNQPVTTTGYTQVRPYLNLSGSSPIDPGVAMNSNISEVNSIGTSNYNAMWATLSKNMSHGLEFNMNYQWTKSMDLNSLGTGGTYVLQDSNNPRNNYGLSDFDVRDHFAGTAMYSLPFKGNRWVEGYQLSTIVQYQTGNPVNITENNSTFNGVAGLIRPNLVGPVVTKKIQQAGATNVSFIQSTVCPITTTLAAPAGCTFQNPAISTPTGTVYTGIGDMQRNGVTGPGFADVDLSAEKDTKLFEQLTFRLRVDAFDILNHPNFGQPSGNTSSTTFGQISSTRFATSDGGSSRQLQISGKFIF
jgi:hypothetical protein